MSEKAEGGLSREQIEDMQHRLITRGSVLSDKEATALCRAALRSLSPEREAVIDEILTGLRSEDDSTQLRAIIASIEALKPAAGNEGMVRVPRDPDAKMLLRAYHAFTDSHQHTLEGKLSESYKAMLAAALSGGRNEG